MKGFMVVSLRDNSVETVHKISPSLDACQTAFLYYAKMFHGEERAKELLSEFAKGTLEDEVIIRGKEGSALQLTSFQKEF